MKIIIIALAVLVGIWLFRSGRKESEVKRTEERRRAAIPQDIVACVVCGVHLPKSEALKKDGASFCSAAHLQSAQS